MVNLASFEQLSDDYKQRRLDLQKNDNTCGLASIRNSLSFSFNCDIPETELWEPAQKIYDDLGSKRKILQDGIGPRAMAKLIKAIGRERLNREFKIFMTSHGEVGQLEYFLERNIAPIIHRPFWEGDQDGHYETVIGMDNSHVYLFNSARETVTSGIHRKTLEEFDKKWWLFDNEKLLLAYYPAGIVLPREKFRRRRG